MRLRFSLVSYQPVCFGLGLGIQDTHMEKYKASMPFICQWHQPNCPCSPSHVVKADCHARSRAHLGCWCSPSLQLLVAGQHQHNTCYSRTLALCLHTQPSLKAAVATLPCVMRVGFRQLRTVPCQVQSQTEVGEFSKVTKVIPFCG